MATASVGSSVIAGSAGVQQLVQLDSWVYLAAGSTGSFLMAGSAGVTKQSGDCWVRTCSCTSGTVSRCTSRCTSGLSTAGLAGIQEGRKQSGDCRVRTCSCTSRAISRCTSRCTSRLSTAGIAGIQKVANNQEAVCFTCARTFSQFAGHFQIFYLKYD